ncbi:hypothetical protein Bca4012_057845 [Brassica carinata]
MINTRTRSSEVDAMRPSLRFMKTDAASQLRFHQAVESDNVVNLLLGFDKESRLSMCEVSAIGRTDSSLWS